MQSFKKVINIAPASVAATTSVISLSLGADAVAAGQTSAIDSVVPTGAIIKYMEIKMSMVNIAATGGFIHVAIQRIHSGQSIVGSDVVGGDDQRNQVHMQRLFSAGESQNTDQLFKFKIPKAYQRVRAGDSWQFVWKNSQTVSVTTQIIYKFYR